MPEEQPTTPGQDPQPIPTIPASPWSSDLEQRFADPAVRAQVDAYVRERVQPHTTKLEQDLAATRDAVSLWEALSSDDTVGDTYLQITRELFPDRADAVAAALQAEQQAAEAQQQQQAPPPAPPALSEDDRQAIEYARRQREEALYEEQFKQVVAEHADANIDRTLFDDSVAVCEGDFTKAFDHYQARLARFSELHPPAPATPGDPAPPVIGSDTGGTSSTTPTTQRYASFKEAIGAMMDQDRAARGAVAPVGSN
jgi:hypothetical protein